MFVAEEAFVVSQIYELSGLVSPFSGLIRKAILKSVKVEAESIFTEPF